jgi:hypothetical protein
LIHAKYVRKHSLIGKINRVIQVSVTEKHLAAKPVSHRSLIRVKKCKVSEDVNGISYAMYVRNISLIAVIYPIISEYTLQSV